MAQNRYYLVSYLDNEVRVTDELHIAQQYSMSDDWLVIDTEVNRTIYEEQYSGEPFEVINHLPGEE